MALEYAGIRDRLDEWLVEHRKRLGQGLGGLALFALLGGGVYWWVEVRFRPPPSIFDSPFDDVLGYLSLDDFSKLPLKDRIAFMIELSDRFRGISQDESVVMAGFFAGLTGPTREQLRQNARELARDILAEGAAQYVNLPKSEQAKFLDGWLVEWTKTAERMATGKVDDKSDQQRLDEMKGQAKRDSTRERNPNRLGSLTEGSASRFLDFWSSDVETAASPRQQGQITRFMTDLRTHMTK
jgi:hypothetical protein